MWEYWTLWLLPPSEKLTLIDQKTTGEGVARYQVPKSSPGVEHMKNWLEGRESEVVYTVVLSADESISTSLGIPTIVLVLQATLQALPGAPLAPRFCSVSIRMESTFLKGNTPTKYVVNYEFL